MPRSLGPAGLVTAPAADVLAFARMHLEGGVAADGSRVLSEDSVALMADRHAELPDTYILGDSWGLGWIRFDWDGHRLIGHDGNTLGQSAFLRMLPEQGLAVTLLTNVSSARDLYEDLFREIFDELAGVAMPHPLSPPETPPMVSAAPHVGTYERASVRLDVLEDQRGAVLRTTVTGPMAELVPDPVEEYVMVPVAEDLFVIRPPDAVNWVPVTFYSLPTGERYLHFGARATPWAARRDVHRRAPPERGAAAGRRRGGARRVCAGVVIRELRELGELEAVVRLYGRSGAATPVPRSPSSCSAPLPRPAATSRARTTGTNWPVLP
jgi:hypothetical protein